MGDERKDYAVLISLSMREEAEVAAAALRADGIDAFVGNSNHAHMEWGLIPALGGMQVMVPASSLAEGKAAIRARILNRHDDDGEPAVRRDHYKAWIIIGWFVFGVLFFGFNILDRTTLDEVAEQQRWHRQMQAWTQQFERETADPASGWVQDDDGNWMRYRPSPD